MRIGIVHDLSFGSVLRTGSTIASSTTPMILLDFLLVGKALQAKIEIWTDGAADAGDLGEVRAAVVAFVQSASFFGCEDQRHDLWLRAIVVVVVAVSITANGVTTSARDSGGCDGRHGG